MEQHAPLRHAKREQNKEAIKNTVIVVLVVLALGLLARYVFFAPQMEKMGDDLERIGEWEDNYKAENPDASNKDVSDAFEDGMSNLQERTEKYKAEHPGATDEEIDAAFKAAWGEK